MAVQTDLRRRWAQIWDRARRRWVASLLFATLVHVAFVLGSAWFKREVRAAEVTSTEPLETIDAEIVEELPMATSGGGSPERGEQEVASGLEPEEVLKPAAVVLPKPEAKPVVRPVTPPKEDEQAEETQEEQADEPEEPENLFAQDLLLSEADDKDKEGMAKPVKPKAAWTQRAKPAPVLAMGKKTGDPGNSRYPGTGAGRLGGPGGGGPRSGYATGPPEGSEFGGAHGAFSGYLCFVREGLRSLREVGQCNVVPPPLRTNVFNITPRHFEHGFPGVTDRIEWFMIRYTGSFEVTTPGKHRFRVVSDDGSVLNVNDRLVVDNDGIHGPASKHGSVDLDAGTHKFELWYFQGPRTILALQVFVTPPGEPERLFGPKI